jgi:4'-phosphopantetheinyl transferase
MNATHVSMPEVPSAGAGHTGLHLGPDRSAPGPPAPGEFHTFLVPVRRRSEWLALLDAEETEQLSRLTVGQARDTYATSHVVQRLIGARYLDLPPAEVCITRECQYCAGAHGRPRFPNGEVDYSVSHTDQWLLAAVTATGLVGVDVESLALNRDVGRMASITLTAAEMEYFKRLPERMRTHWFVRTWTRKEAAMKLVGLGLAAPPGELDVAGRILSVGKVPRWPDLRIFLHDLPAPPGHAAALASTIEPTAVRVVPPPHILTLDVVS